MSYVEESNASHLMYVVSLLPSFAAGHFVDLIEGEVAYLDAGNSPRHSFSDYICDGYVYQLCLIGCIGASGCISGLADNLSENARADLINYLYEKLYSFHDSMLERGYLERPVF